MEKILIKHFGKLWLLLFLMGLYTWAFTDTGFKGYASFAFLFGILAVWRVLLIVREIVLLIVIKVRNEGT